MAVFAATVCGAKITFKVALWPTASVTPTTLPLVVKSVSDTVMPEMVKPEFPLFFKVTGMRWVFPTVSLPKSRLVGETERDRVAAVPVPLILMGSAGRGLFKFTVRVPLIRTAEAGVKARLKWVVAPAARVRGTVNPLT